MSFINFALRPNHDYGFKQDITSKPPLTMTYILASRCNDGVVMISDKKFMIDNGTDYGYDDKLFNILSSGIVVGFSGYRGTFELFQTRIHEYLSDYPEKENNTDKGAIRVDKILLQISDITHNLNNKYYKLGNSFGS